MKREKNFYGYISGTGCMKFTGVKGGILVGCFRVATTIDIDFVDVDCAYGTDAALNFKSTPLEPIGPNGGYLGPWVEQSWEVFVPFNKIFRISLNSEESKYFISSPKGVMEIELWREINGSLHSQYYCYS